MKRALQERPPAISSWGQALRHVRTTEEKGAISARHVAHQAGVAQSVVDDWEADRALPSRVQLKRVVGMLPRMIPYDQLWQDAFRSPPEPERGPRSMPRGIGTPVLTAETAVVLREAAPDEVAVATDPLEEASLRYGRALREVSRARHDVDRARAALSDAEAYVVLANEEAAAARRALEDLAAGVTP